MISIFLIGLLQNEEKLSFRVVTDGVFERAQYLHLNHLYALKGHEYFKENVKDVFYFGEPILESEVIIFDRQKLLQDENKARLGITFGGRFSPRKSSEYILDLSKQYDYNLDEIVISKVENKLTKDLQDERGITKELVIKTFINK